VAVVVSPESYPLVSEELKLTGGRLSLATRSWLALTAFMHTSRYDDAIFRHLGEALSVRSAEDSDLQSGFTITEFVKTHSATSLPAAGEPYPANFSLPLEKHSDLRYGENPHQRAALYALADEAGIARAELLGGKEMSFNNYVDADAAWQLVCDFDDAACAIIKHMNPAGVGVTPSLEEAYRLALATDPVSAFGGIVAFNRRVDEPAARALTEIFTEVVVAPDFDEPAVEVLKSKKNLRILRAGEPSRPSGLDFKRVTGGMLVQTRDTHRLRREDLKVVTRRRPSEEEVEALLFAWTVCKHTKSNAIVYARAGQTVGVGAGQMSRVDSVRIGAMRAQLPVAGSVLASDAFFPFRDGLDEAARHGITAVIQPGGSVRDAEVVAAADEHGLAMVFTGVRHFRH
jgi:phosphoribosylaminoimidazolecarboxamide formyltransferase/IMP cyclohydrolase